jgi:poly(3-hydroxybutyrate) depolymerase
VDEAEALTVRAVLREDDTTRRWPLRTVVVEGVAPGGEVVLSAETEAPPADRGWALRLPLADDAGWDRLVLRARLLAGERVLGRGETAAYSQAGLVARTRRLARALRALPAEKRTAPEAALLRLSLEQATLLQARTPEPGADYGAAFHALLERAAESLRELAARTGPYAGPAGLHEAAYIARNDGSVQPFRVYAPVTVRTARAENRRLPLLLFLHGYVPSYTKLTWLSIPPTLAEAMEATGMLLALPYGRSNTDFLTVGEVDVLRVLEEMRARYPVDPDRVYLAGYSMGGSGVWTLLAHHPDIFAAAQVWCGRTDWYTWHAKGLSRHGLTPGTLPRYKRVLIDTDNPLTLAETLRDIPVHAVHARDDPAVRVGHTLRMHERLAPPDGRMRATILESGGHFIFAEEWDDAASYRWMLEHVRRAPETIRHAALHPRYGGKHWIEIGRIAPWGRRARAEAAREGQTRTVRIGALEAVDALGLRLPVDGEGRWRLLQPEPAPLPLERSPGRGLRLLEAVTRTEPLKTARLAGPVKEAFRTPFLLVPGSIGPEAATERLSRQAERFRREWYEFAQGLPPVMADRDVTERIEERFNLVCFGTPRTNAVLRRIGERLPFRFPEDGYGVGGMEVRGEGLGFAAIHPNPDAPERSVVILDGLYYGDGLARNHKWDLVPDYLVFDARRDPLDGTNRARLAGFFDVTWQVDPALAETFPGPEPARADEAAAATTE